MKKFIAVFVSTLTVAALLLVGCTKESEPKTVESIITSNEDIAATIQSGADDAGVKIDIKDNNITYSYDISNVDGINEEMLEDEDFVKSLEDSIESHKAWSANVCKKIEDKAGIEGVVVNVIYTYNEKEIVSKSFTSADIEAEDSTEEPAEEAEESDE